MVNDIQEESVGNIGGIIQDMVWKLFMVTTPFFIHERRGSLCQHPDF
jgi:hypothetical protein